MALKTLIQTKYGVDFPDAYISFVSFTCDKISVQVVYNIYVNEQAKIGGKPPIDVGVHEIVLTQKQKDNFCGFIYTEMKNGQMFSSAEDV